MQKKWLKYLLLLTALLILTTCAPGKDSYHQGEELSQMGNWEGAIAFYQDALAREPNNKTYQEALQKARQEAAKKYYQRAVSTWTGAAVKDYQAVTKALTSLNKAIELDPENEKIISLHQQLETKKKELTEEAKTSYQQGVVALNKKQWLEAFLNFRRVNDIYPNYEDTEDKLAVAVAAGSDEYYKQGIAAVQREDWKGALSSFSKVMTIAHYS
jgi:tetratricopeptide (TPR) repeat protein